MVRAIDVANFYVKLSATCSEYGVTNLRLNKLIYFAQGWSLAKRGKVLFDDDFEAWKLGPVVPSVYHTFKPCGSCEIQEPSDEIVEDVFSIDEKLLLIDVIREYSSEYTSTLVNFTHEPGTPWANTDSNEVIPKDLIRSYFANIPPLPTFSFQPSSNVETLKRDSAGVPILPAYEYSPEDDLYEQC